ASPAAGGWHRTGDLARFDADGELFVVGRADDLIIQGGHNVYAETVAEIVRQLPEVKECAVVGVPSDFLGQEVVACVALQEQAVLAAGDIVAHCRKHLEPLAVPASVWFVPALPRNESGKIKIFELREALQATRNTTRSTGFVQQLAGAPPAERQALMRQEIERIVAAIVDRSRSCGIPGAENFQDMGLDSLGAVELTHALSESIGRPVSTTLAYSHPSLDAACQHLLALTGLADRGDASAAELSPAPIAELRPRLESYFSPEELAAVAARTASLAPQQPAAVVLLTGANGFLGRFMTLEILGRLPPEGRLYALVRAPNPSAARERLLEAYGHDTALQNMLEQQIRAGRVILLDGDLTLPQLGLARETYDRLCREVDCIIHNGAAVDHVLGYRALFAPNVMGTVEIIRLALAGRAKMINYVSSIAARPLGDDGEGQLAAGYSATKWASEILLQELFERTGMPVRVYRPSYIVAHTRMPGQINPHDTLTRLLHGIATTSLAPRSFYAQGRSTKNSSYDGCPVDFVARSIATLSMAETRRPGYVTYNIVNPHGGGSLDSIADWVASAGYPVQKMDDYGAWCRAFEGRLNALSRPQRQRSLLPLLHAWERPRAARGPDHDTQSFRRDMARISQAAKAPALETPQISEPFIHKCLKDMQILGMIGAPPMSAGPGESEQGPA
ncbi:MAG TPA: thioester reductase domain-containing protein, partial [Dongiaceae bacterium]|nr:thioester reductase domain-containing protein [Dongiaceae bacterium]